MAGVTENGFVGKTQAEIKADIEASQKAEISPTLDLSSDSVLGQNNGIFARELAIAWEALEEAYYDFDPDRAEDDALTSLGKLTGTERRAASYSLVVLTCDLDVGTTLTSGIAFAAVEGDSENRWTPEEDYTAATDGAQNVTFRAEETGPVEATDGTITVIATPVSGWHSVTNDLSASPGRTIDSDETLRTRREQQLAATGSATTSAIRADVLEVEGVETCQVFQNVGNRRDANGLPGHSIEVLIYDGDPSAADDDEIAQAIFESRAGGVQTFGSSSGTATDDDSEEHTEKFSRVAHVQIYLDYQLETDSDYPGDTFLKGYVVDTANARFDGSGEDALGDFCRTIPYGVAGVVKVLDFAIGTSPAPTTDTDITIGVRELARFDEANVTVT